MSWLGRVFRRRALERDLDREVRFHLESAIADHVRGGMSPQEAYRTARLEFGGVEYVKEQARDARATRWLEDFLVDVRQALRAMRRAPALSAAAILTLALGIGANTAVWSIVEALMRRALPVARPAELYAVRRAGLQDNVYNMSYDTMRRMQHALADSTSLAGFSSSARMYVDVDGSPQPVVVQLVSGNYFPVLGVRAERGRLIAPADDRELDASPVVVISDDYWTRQFGRDPGIVGRTLRVGGTSLTVIGVAGEGFAGLTVGSPTDAFVPLVMQSGLHYRGNASSHNSDTEKPWIPQKGISWLTLVTRQPAAQPRIAAAGLEAIWRVVVQEENATTDSATRAYAMREHIALEPIPRGFSPLRQQFGDPLRVVMASVGLVLLITCANLAGLLLARSAARDHELSVRVALGARPGRLVRQALTESLTLAVIGGAAGMVVARWATGALLTLASTGTRPLPIGATLSGSVLLFALAITLAAGLLFGLAPALRAARTDLYETFKTGGRVFGGRSHRLPLGRLLVVGQVAVSLMLVTAAGVFVRTFQNLVRIDVGYEREQLVTVRLDTRAAGFTYAQLPGLYDRLVGALRAVPGARSASLSLMGLASGGTRISGFDAPGRHLAPADQQAQENLVSPDYFKTTGMPLVSGRAFTDRDVAGSPLVVILNQSAVRRFFGTDSVIGRHFGYGSDQPWTIVGVVRDARVNSLRESPSPLVLRPLAQNPQDYATSAEVRVVGSTATAIPSIRNALASVDRRIPVRDITTMETLLERGLTTQNLVARVAAGFGLLALLLAAIGLYGVISYSVARRTNEMGVRLALGASPGRVSIVVLREALGTVGGGIIVGLVLWLPLIGLTRRLVYGLSPHDPMSVAAGSVLLLAAGLVAALLPARRAARIDPIEAIRAE